MTIKADAMERHLYMYIRKGEIYIARRLRSNKKDGTLYVDNDINYRMFFI